MCVSFSRHGNGNGGNGGGEPQKWGRVYRKFDGRNGKFVDMFAKKELVKYANSHPGPWRTFKALRKVKPTYKQDSHPGTYCLCPPAKYGDGSVWG